MAGAKAPVQPVAALWCSRGNFSQPRRLFAVTLTGRRLTCSSHTLLAPHILWRCVHKCTCTAAGRDRLLTFGARYWCTSLTVAGSTCSSAAVASFTCGQAGILKVILVQTTGTANSIPASQSSPCEHTHTATRSHSAGLASVAKLALWAIRQCTVCGGMVTASCTLAQSDDTGWVHPHQPTIAPRETPVTCGACYHPCPGADLALGSQIGQSHACCKHAMQCTA